MWSIHKIKNSIRQFVLKDLDSNVKHLKNKIENSLPINLPTEKGLTENGIRKKFLDGDKICVKQCCKMEIYWRASPKC